MNSEAIRGGLTNTVCRYREANNTQLPSTYDQNKPKSSLLYIDCNNLYWQVMSQKLPISNFKWDTNIDHFPPRHIINIDPNGDESYFFKVDLHFPPEARYVFNQLPPCPELKCIQNSKV